MLDQGHLVAEGTPGELKRQIAGSHVRFRFTDASELDAAARVLTGSTRDDEDLTLRVPSDGGVKSLRALLGRLDKHSIDVEEFSVRTPDLDDVFLALTKSSEYGGHRTMSITSAPLTDSRTMLRRNLKHILRNPVTIFNGALMPVVLMLLLVYVLGNAFNVGEHYIEYATPGLILLAITYGLSATAVSVNSDMTKGIINRFKDMNVSRGAVLTGHVVATVLSCSVAIGVIIGMAFALGFRSPATLPDWLGAIGIIAAAAFAAAWLTVALGIAAKTRRASWSSGFPPAVPARPAAARRAVRTVPARG